MRIAAALALTLALSCARPAPRAAAPPSEIERAYPALAWVPAGASWVVSARRLGDLATGLRELLEPVARLQGDSIDELDRELAALLGGSPLRLADLEDAGLDLAGGVALFGVTAGSPTAVARIADPERLARAIAARRPESNVSSTLYQGHELYTWQPDAELAVSWLSLDGWLVVHAGAVRDGRAWLDAVLSAPSAGGLGDTAALASTIARAKVPPGALGLLRPRLLLGQLRPLLGGELGCAIALTAAVDAVTASGDFDGVRGWVDLEVALAPAAAAELGRAIGPQARPGLLGFRTRAGLYASLALDLGWLQRAAVRAGCGELDLVDPLQNLTGGPAGRAYHVAAADLDVETGSGRGLAQLALRDARAIRALLDGIPGRGLLERRERVEGVEVRALPSLPGLPALAYRLTDGELIAGIGDGAMRVLLARGAPARGRELAAFGVAPARAGKLADLIALVARLAGDHLDGLAAEALAAALARYESIDVRLSLTGDRLTLRAAIRLQR